MEVIRLKYKDKYWEKAIAYAKLSSWPAGKHLSTMMSENNFTDWEAVFFAIENNNLCGYCTFLKEDYYPENKYSPWISCIFVDEITRGKRVSHKLIESAVCYAKTLGFSKVYIPSDMLGFYEKCGFQPINTLKNYAGDIDTVFMREI